MCFVDCFGSLLEVGVTVRETHDEGRGNHSVAYQLLQEERTEALRRVAILVTGCVNQIAGTPENFKITLQPVFGYRPVDEIPQALSLPPQVLHYFLLAVDSDGFKRRCQSMGFRAMRRGEEKDSRLGMINPA